MKKIVSYFPLFLLLVLGTLLLGTRRDFSRPNLNLFTEMTRSPAPQSQESHTFFSNKKTQQLPVYGTIPRDFYRFPYQNTEAERARAAQELKNPLAISLDVLERGKHLYQNFCMHCHGLNGKGDGPVAKQYPLFSMPIVSKATSDISDGEIFHIVTYGRNNMPPHFSQISQPDRWKLLHYLRDMQQKEMQRLASQGLLYEEEDDPRRYNLISEEYGHELYQQNCASCHGNEGRKPIEGVPTLNHPRVLAIAQSDYYRDIIAHGRKGTQMPAWDQIFTPTQIQSVVSYIRSWANPSEQNTEFFAGDIQSGKALYRGNCMGCHGSKGEGGIGNRLNSPSFLALASEGFIRDTIKFGRKHTAMPSGFAFNEQELNDLVSYLQSWKSANASWENVQKILATEGGASTRTGKKLWTSRCASCHGKDGEGGIGARIQSQSFLTRVEDQFLYRSIVEGRPGTSMPAWYFLEDADVADLIAYIRQWQKQPAREMPKRSRIGRAEFGEYLYKQACFSCHGPEGSGGVGGQIGNTTFLSSVSDEFLWETIAYGKDDTAMRGFLEKGSSGALMPLSENDIDHLIAYLRKLELYPRNEPLRRPRESTSVALGQEVYKTACASCHGDEGQGGSGPAIGNADFLKVATDGYLIGTIILGREQTEMLSFYRGGNVQLSQEEVENVTAYLRSLEETPSKKHREVVRSESIVREGNTLYLNHCASCHGSDGKGPASNVQFDGYAPSLNNQEFLHAANDGFLLATIALGRSGTPMRAFAKGVGGISDLSANEISQIVAFIRSWEEGK